MPMSEVTGTWLCPTCGALASRLFNPPCDHSENTFHPYYSDALSPGAAPVYLASRSAEQQQMDKMGMSLYEKGMKEDTKKAWNEHKENLTRKTLDEVREPTIRKLYYAKTYGSAPRSD